MQFCAEIERDKKLSEEYHSHLKRIKKWYSASVERYSNMITSELLLNAMEVDVRSFDGVDDIFDLAYQYTTKTSFFSVSDALVKLMLSQFAIGPSVDFFNHYGIDFKDIARIQRFNSPSWIKEITEESGMAEILACVLRAKGIHFSFDLKSLMVERSVRSALTHAAKDEVCYSTVRCYNNIRKMLVFLEPQYENELLSISFPLEMHLNADDFMSPPGGVDFSSGTNILIVDSVHDVPESQRSVVANLAWDIVFDLDGYSNFGGMLDCVKHNKIQSEVLTGDTLSNAAKLLPDNTLWYRCGEYLSVDYNRATLEIPSYADFHRCGGTVFNGLREKQNNMRQLFIEQLKKAFSMGRKLHIVVLTDNERVSKALIDAAQQINNNDYFITWVGMTDWDEKSEKQSFSYDLAYAKEHFRYLKNPISSVFSMLEQHSNQLKARQTAVVNFDLPARDGKWVSLSQNDRNNLRQYFNILYRGCEQVEPDEASKQKQLFFLGNQASWYTIANKYAVALKEPSEFNTILGKIKTLLGLLQEKPDNRIFFISHKPGFGGSTLARQLAWSLHDQYPVLEVHSFVSGAIPPLIENLYDNIVETQPVVLLADDTLPDIERLCADVRNINRRCLLIVACRNTSMLLSHYPKANIVKFSVISDGCIKLLRDRFCAESSLSAEEKKKKDERYYDNLPLDWQTPFIIGLYYRDRDFNIKNYVSKAIDACGEKRFEEFVAFLAMCDRFQYKEIPASFWKAWLAEKRKTLINVVPETESLISFYRNSANLDCYRFKHVLLAEEYLHQYAERMYGSDKATRNAYYNISSRMIAVGAEGYKKGIINESDLTVLIDLLIRNKSADWQDTSDLLEEINVPENQRQLMQQLAEAFEPLAQTIINRGDDVRETANGEGKIVLRLTSHSFAHLGRLFAKNGRPNYNRASDMAQKSFEYRPNDDPIIYHMAGMSLLEKLENNWKRDTQSHETLTNDKIESYECEFNLAAYYFDFTIDMGSPDYGFPSLLRLYYHYLNYIYKAKGINSIGDVHSLLNEKQHDLLSEFTQILDEAESCRDLEGDAPRQIEDWKEKYESGVLFRDYSSIVEYYQNKADSLKGRDDIVGYERAVKNLVFARIRKAQFDNPGKPFYRELKANVLLNLKDSIEELLGRPYRKDSYADYRERNRLYHYWMQLAKVLSTDVSDGLVYARAWKDMEGERPFKLRDSEPLYYEMVLNYLDALDGAIGAIRGADRSREDNMSFSSRKIRDVLVNGTGMGRLLDVSRLGKEEEVLAQVESPIVLEGRLHETKYESTGFIRIHTPMAFRDETARVELGKRARNTLTDKQRGHRVQFLAGFSMEGIVAIPSTAKDIDSGEMLDTSALLFNYVRSKCADADEKEPPKIAQKQSGQQATVPVEQKTRSIIHERRLTELRSSEEIPSASDKTIKSGKVVKAKPERIVSDICFATCAFDDTAVQIKVILKGKADKSKAEKALKSKGDMLVRITGYSNNTYSGKLQ